MVHSAPARWLTDAFSPLASAFGGAMRFSRNETGAVWSYDGHSAIVELSGPDRILARFLAQPQLDEISGRPTTPVYESAPHGYPLTPTGCERMVTDIVDFFSGTREPRFTFVTTT